MTEQFGQENLFKHFLQKTLGEKPLLFKKNSTWSFFSKWKLTFWITSFESQDCFSNFILFRFSKQEQQEEDKHYYSRHNVPFKPNKEN